METTWRSVWKNGFCPQLSDRALESLAVACETDDKRLTQRSVVQPLVNGPPESACAVGWCIWQGDDCQTILEVCNGYNLLLQAADRTLGEPGASGYFLDFFDSTPRPEALRELAHECRRELERRADEREAEADRQRDPFEPRAEFSPVVVRIADVDVADLVIA